MSFCFIAHFTPINTLRFYRILLWIEPDSFRLYQLFPLEKFIFTPLSLEYVYQTQHSSYPFQAFFFLISFWSASILVKTAFSMFVSNIFEMSMSFCVSSYIICLEKNPTLWSLGGNTDGGGSWCLFRSEKGSAFSLKGGRGSWRDSCVASLLLWLQLCALEVKIWWIWIARQMSFFTWSPNVWAAIWDRSLQCELKIQPRWINENGVFVSISGILMGL